MAFWTLSIWRAQPLCCAGEAWWARKRRRHPSKRANSSSRTETASCCSRLVLIRTDWAASRRLAKQSTWTVAPWRALNDCTTHASVTKRALVCNSQQESALASGPEVLSEGYPQVQVGNSSPDEVWHGTSKQLMTKLGSLSSSTTIIYNVSIYVFDLLLPRLTRR